MKERDKVETKKARVKADPVFFLIVFF